MTVETVNLWPADFGESTSTPPVTILRQQAAALGEKTKNIVIGRVNTGGNGSKFVQQFSIFCPPLGFETPLLRVNHGIELYPAAIDLALEDDHLAASSPDELMEALKNVFSRPKTKQIIASLLAQSRA